MMDIIKVPFGYLMDWLCQFVGNYGVALILFSLILKLVLMPFSAKSKKSMLKISRLSPQLKALEIECGDDKQRYQQEMSKLYKSEGVSMFGGCLWSFLPLLILIPLYGVIREPITYMMHYTAEEAKQIVEAINSLHPLSSNAAYQQLEAAAFVGQFRDTLATMLPHIDPARLQSLNFMFLGMDMSQIPQWKIWEFFGQPDVWQKIGLFLVPLLSAGSQILSMLVSQKMNNKVATNSKGEQDEAAAAAANSTGKSMMVVMPLMSLYICFIMPAAISIYWIAQAVFGTLQDVFLGIHYRKVYEEEDAAKREQALLEAAKEAERERVRAERRAMYGEEGIRDKNTSKKKQAQKAAAEQKAAIDAYAASQMPEQPEQEPEADDTANKHFSGDPERPFCCGRGYKPTRYGRKDESVTD